MLRATVFVIAAMCIIMSAASPSAYNRDISVLDLDSEEDTFPEDFSVDSKTNNLGQLGAVIFAIKDQFKDIIEEIALQLFKYVVEIMKHYKVKLLKKLGMYTLSDVFHTIFDGVTDFVVDTTTDMYSEEAILTKPIKRPTYYSNPYGLSGLF